MYRRTVISAHEALARFSRSTDAFLAVVDEVTDAGWPVRPPGEEWSPAEAVEHVVLTNRATLTRLRTPAGAVPPAPEATRFPDAGIVDAMFARAAPPGLAAPTGRLATRADGVAALREVHDAVAACVRDEGDGLRARGYPHPVFGVFDGVQWVLFVAAHTDNHLPQLRRLADACARRR